MFWRRGWILNSLKYQVEKNLRETVYSTDSYKEHKWGILERQIILWSGHTRYYICLLLTAVGLLSLSLHMLKPFISAIAPGGVSNWRWLLNWQAAFLSAQLTIIGVIFPLVIGLVGFLLQSKTASKAIWSVYNHYSGFLFTGFSSLLLAVFIITGRYFDSLISGYGYLFHCLISTGWLILNIYLTAWFLFSTFKIIQERSRDALLLRYTINESCIDSIRRKLSELIPQNAFHSRLIECPEGVKTEISTFRFSRENESIYARHFDKAVYIKNIYFRLLNVALGLLFRRSSMSDLDEDSRLVIPASADNVARKEVILATSTGFELKWLEKLMLDLAYKFSKRPPFDPDTFDDIIYSLVGAAADELKNRNPKLFEDAIERMAKWHCSLSDSLSFVNDDKQLDNWLLLPSAAYFSRTYLDSLLREYYMLARQAISLLHESTEYFEEIAYLHLKIYNWNKEQLPQKIAKELVRGHYLTWAALIQWSSITEKPAGSSIQNQYENALLLYVGAWESWPMYLEPRSNRWTETTKSVPVFINHLRYTAQQVVIAIRHDDNLSAEWAADMLLHWFSNISIHRYHGGQYIWLHELITPNLLEKDINDEVWRLILKNNAYDEKAATQLAMENAWLDVRIVCACYIALKPKAQDSNLSARVVNSLLKGVRFHPTGSLDISTTSIDSGADLLSAYIRQRGYWESGEGSYRNWLDSIVDAFNQIDEPKRVSGRIYSGWGSNDVRSLNVQYVRLTILLSDRPWVLSSRWIDVLFSNVVEHQDRENLISDLTSWLKIADENIEPDEEITKEKILHFKSSLNETIKLIKTRSVDEIKNAEIDEERLLQFGRSASVSGFSKETGSFLLGFFEEIRFTDQPINGFERILNISGYSKSNVAKDVAVNRAVNEDEWLDSAIGGTVANNLYDSLCGQVHATESSFENSLDLFKRASADIRDGRSDGHDFILFIGPWALNRYLDDITYGITQPGGLNVEQRNGFGDSYICHLEGSPVYQLPDRRKNFSLLVPANIFKVVTFTKFEEGRFVDVTTKDLDEEELKLTLVLKYYMKPEFLEAPIHRYVSLGPDEG